MYCSWKCKTVTLWKTDRQHLLTGSSPGPGALLAGVSSHNREAVGTIPRQGACLGCGFNPQSRCIQSPGRVQTGGNQPNAPLSH